MRNTKLMAKIVVMLLCGAVVWGPGDSAPSDGDFYVIGGGSPWRQSGNNIYYEKGSVGIGKSPESMYSLDVFGGINSTASSAADPAVSGYNLDGGCAVYGWSYHSFAVVGQVQDETGYGVYCYGNFAVENGTKNAIVGTSQGKRKTYSQESPEVWFEDFGEGQLAGGLARVELDSLFLETVTINDQNPMKVFIQLNDDCNGVYVQRQANGFEVKELRAGTSSARFTYRVVAKRNGFENVRLEAAPDTTKVAALKAPLKEVKK